MLRDLRLAIPLAVVLIVVATWPLALHLDSTIFVSFLDPDLQWGMRWPRVAADAILDGRSPFFLQDMNWPEGQDARLLLWNYAGHILFIPIARLAEPIAMVNLITWTCMLLNGLAAAVAARWITGSRAAMVLALVIGTVSSYTFHESGSGRSEQALWAPMPLYFAAIVKLRSVPGSKIAIGVAGASLAYLGACYWFYAYFLVVMTLALAIGWAATRQLDRRGFTDLALVGLLALVLVTPFLAPIVSALLEQPDFIGQVEEHSGTALSQQARAAMVFPLSYAGPFLLEQSEPQRLASSPHTAQVIPALTIPIGIAIAWRAQGPIRTLGWLIVMGAALGAGPVLQVDAGHTTIVGNVGLRMPHALLNLLPGFGRFWWPYRWIAPTVAATALGAGWLVSRAQRPWILTGALSAWWLVEFALIARGGVACNLPLGSQIEIPGALTAIGRLEGLHPIVQLPMIRDGLLPSGTGAWTGQPIDAGVGWSLPMARTPGYAQRLASVPLLKQLMDVQNGIVVSERLEPWTEQDTGGFHYVMYYPGSPSLKELPPAGPIGRLLGPPFYCDDLVVAWAIPGVSEPPPPYTTVSDTSRDPCSR